MAGSKRSFSFILALHSLILFLTGQFQISYAVSAGSISSWNSTTGNFPYRIESHTAESFNGYVYVLGGMGRDAGAIPYARYTPSFAKVKSDGDLEPWQTTTPFSTGRYLHSTAIDPDNRKIYIIGGWDTNQKDLSDVQFAQILSNGHIGAWTPTTSFPTIIYGHSSAVYDGYLYVLAGEPGASTGVYFAKINHDGTIGEWQVCSNRFLSPPRRYSAIKTYNGIFYMSGGQSTWGPQLSDVQYAPIKPALTWTGRIDEWKTTTSLVTPRSNHTCIATNGFVYILGGVMYEDSGETTYYNDVFYARINSDNALGSWTPTASLPSGISDHASAFCNGYIYNIGGNNTNSVYYGKLNDEDNTPPRTTFSQPAGAYSESFYVILTCDDGLGSGCAATYYTRDGSNPTTDSTAYDTPIGITSDTTLKFFSTDLDGNLEDIVHLEYIISSDTPKKSEGIIYPVGSCGPYGLCPDSIGNTSCYWVCQDFLENVDNNCNYIGPGTHLGEDWNRGTGYKDYGDTIYAVSEGDIEYAQDAGSGWGNVIIIRHILPNGTQVESLYGHLRDMLRTSGKVYRGEPIGTMGDSSVPPASHLHFEIRYPNCREWGHHGPGYSSDSTGWTDPSNFIDANKADTLEINKVSISNDGTQGNNDSYSPAISSSGQHIAFRTLASNISMNVLTLSSNSMHLQSGVSKQTLATNPVTGGVYLYDRQTRSINEINSDGSGTLGNGSDFTASFSTDGRFKVFASDASNLVSDDTNGVSDIFVHDQQTGAVTRVSVDSAGNQSNGMSYDAGISADGNYAVFTSNASNLVSGDTNSAKDVFVHNRQTGETRRISVDESGTQSNGDSYQPSISANGQYVVFVSEATNLVPADSNGVADIFTCKIESGEIWRLSVDNNGNQSNGSNLHPSISSEGRHVAFESNGSNLVPDDNNGVTDIFIRDRLNSTIQRISLDENGVAANGPSHEPKISSYGLNVAFISYASNLVSGDTNGKADIFVSYLTHTYTLPTVSTNSATSVTSSSATLNGTVNPNGASTTVTFEYGTTTSYGSTATATQSPLTGTTSQPVSKGVTGLTSGTTYHYRVTGINSAGTTNGSDNTFTTVSSCSECTGDTVNLTGVTFESGTNCECAATTSITIGTRVTVKSGATVTFKSPTVKIESGFHAENGAVVNIKQQ